ncbi:MAG: hypothetical protein RJA10_118 [Pseudomonadota bacterium]
MGLGLALGLTLAAPAALAGSPRFCERGTDLGAAQHDKRLRLVARLRQELQASGTSMVLISRSGTDLSRFAQRYSHAGIALKDSPNTPWSVRQLYYACDEGRPRLFDQGLAGFMLAADDSTSSHVSLVMLPPGPAVALEAAALDRQLSLQILATTYSANAHAFSTRYQNCNQWVAELMAAAWGGLGAQPTREQAQAWLQAQGYEPHRFEAASWWLALAARLVPLLHHDDHPEADLRAGVYRVSMPSSLEAFVRQRLPGAQRVELCQDDRHIVVRRGWQPLGPGCEAGPGDERLAFDDPAGGGPLRPI